MQPLLVAVFATVMGITLNTYAVENLEVEITSTPYQEQGTVTRRILAADPELPYWVYLPAGAPQPKRIMVSIHGISRNIEEHLAALRPWADEYGVALILPLFDELDFFDYQRLGRTGHGPRADIPLLGVLDEVQKIDGLDTRKIDLFGYSGGAQFAHRFAMIHPQRVSRLALAAAGWYTWPNSCMRYPFGLNIETGLENASADIRAFLQIPMCVFVGKHDVERSRSLNTSRLIDSVQGLTRRERARNWTQVIREEGLRRGIPVKIHYELLPRTKHAFRRAVTHGGLMGRLFGCFYEE